MKERTWWRFSGLEITMVAASAGAIVFGVAYAAAQPHMASSSWGLAEGQTARLTVTNLADGSVAPSPCAVQYKIYTADGSVLKISSELKLDAGASASTDLKFSDLVRSTDAASNSDLKIAPDSSGRFQLRAESFMLKSSDAGRGASDASCADHKVSQFYKLSVEVLDDNTGRTTFSPALTELPAVQRDHD